MFVNKTLVFTKIVAWPVLLFNIIKILQMTKGNMVTLNILDFILNTIQNIIQEIILIISAIMAAFVICFVFFLFFFFFVYTRYIFYAFLKSEIFIVMNIYSVLICSLYFHEYYNISNATCTILFQEIRTNFCELHNLHDSMCQEWIGK